MNLKKIREQIGSLRAEYMQLQKALPTVDENKNSLLAGLNTRYVAPYANLRERLVTAMNSGRQVQLPDDKEMPNFVFGLILQDGLLDPMLESIASELKENKSIARMPTAEKKTRTEELLAEIYRLEMAEQELIGDDEQRDDVSGCALLGLPFEIAKSAGFI